MAQNMRSVGVRDQPQASDRPLIPLPVGGGGLISLPLRGRGRGGVNLFYIDT